ncbi:N-glycosidase YbiA-like [Oscarella lobularis]|uniref:N-glycosidase YbiA-like n=1 Tax=Oscarella lobularis TaxID=121494 RepID=UPI003313CAEA
MEEMFTFFWKSLSPFSQWHPAKFTVDGIVYNCAEQFMMHQKAILFKDDVTASEVLETEDPAGQKKLGRKVRGFDEDVWKKHRMQIVKAASKAKFTQNDKLKSQLLATAGTTLVEASPVDRIWGIGLSATDKRAQRRETWRGQNLLGQALTETRDEILAETK